MKPTSKLSQFLLLSVCLNLIVVGIANAQASSAWPPLEEKYSLQDLSGMLVPRDQWSPFPSVRNPQDFDKVPEAIKNQYIHDAEQLLQADWPTLPATVFMEFKRNGNRSDYEKLSFQRRQMLATLVLAEAFERKGRFVDQIVNGVWAICEESFWGVPAHMHLQKAGPGLPDVEDPVVDLFAAETAQEMAWTYYLLKPELDKVDTLIARRIELETQRRIFEPYLKHTDWGYLGFEWKKHPDDSRRVNNWNPWINSNVLATALVLAKDPQKRDEIVYKTMSSVDNFVVPYPKDGGSDEGPEYWGRAAGSLLDYLETLKSATDGKIDYFNQPVVNKMGQYIYKMYISYPYFVNFGDADAKIFPDPTLLYRFGRDTHDEVLQHFAAFVYQQEGEKRQKSSDKGMASPGTSSGQAKRPQLSDEDAGPLHFPFGALNRALPALMVVNDLMQTKPEEPLLRDVWLPDLQVMAARSEEGSSKGFYLMAKGGTNGASHNHNDVGNYIVYHDGEPVLVDAGAQTYTAQTFSSRRYELWNNQSRYHNLPDINGFMQHEGIQYAAQDVQYHENAKKSSLSMELAKAYPAEAKVKTWQRTVTLNRGKDVEITENYQLDAWVNPMAENFLTPYKPDISKPGVIVLTGPGETKHYIEYDKNRFAPSAEPVAINDERMTKNWGHQLYHIVLKSKGNRTKDKFVIKVHD